MPPGTSGAGSAFWTQSGAARRNAGSRAARDLAAVAQELTGRTKVLVVMDREVNCFALFDGQRRGGWVELLV